MRRLQYLLKLLAMIGLISGFSQAVGPLISGKVIDESGRAVNAASVALESLDGTIHVEITTKADGLFSAEGIPEGQYSIGVTEPNHVNAIYGPISLGASSPSNLTVKLERPPNYGPDLVTCDLSLVRGRVEGIKNNSASEMLLCMRGSKGKTCTHLAGNGSFSTSVVPGKYTLKLQDPGQQDLVSQVLDATYCGEYRIRITLLQ